MSQIFHLSYVVEPRPYGWTVVFGPMDAGRYETRRDALRSAWRDASFCRSLGHDVSLQARLRDGRLRCIRIPSWDAVCDNSPVAPICASNGRTGGQFPDQKRNRGQAAIGGAFRPEEALLARNGLP